MWLIDINNTDDWPVSNIKIVDGKRDINDFIDECKKLSFVKKIELSDQSEFFVVLGNALNLDEQKLVNTLTVFENNDYLIQFCYHQDYVNYNEPEFNYFSTIINTTNEIVFGKACFFMIEKTSKKLVDLSLEKLLSLLINIHIFSTCQIRNGDLEEICFPNIKGHIDDIFKDYKKHKVYNWEFYIPKIDDEEDLYVLGIKEVCIHKYNNLIILKTKEENTIDDENIKKNNIDLNQIRGIYLDLEKKYLSKLFLRHNDSNNYLSLEQYKQQNESVQPNT
jgi:hypothetical protein